MWVVHCTSNLPPPLPSSLSPPCLMGSYWRPKVLTRVLGEGRYLLRKIFSILHKLLFCDILRIIWAWSGKSFAQYFASYAIFCIIRNILHHTQQVLRNFVQNNLRQKQNSAKFAQKAIFCAKTTSCIIIKFWQKKFIIFFEFT